MMKRLHCTIFIILGALFLTSSLLNELSAQCENPTIALPDASNPVNGNVSAAYCVTLTFDPDELCFPTGITMDITHSYQGDLSLMIVADNGNVLSIFQRPGVALSCGGGCPCGNTNNLGGVYTFTDLSAVDPENGMALNGGTYGISADDGCGVGTPGINSFADLWATYSPGEIVTTQICITDHAFADVGTAADITFNFPCTVNVICGCTDPDAINFDPSAQVDDGSCIYCDLEVTASTSDATVCAGETFSLNATATMGPNPTYEWTATDGADAFLSNPNIRNPTVNVPLGFGGFVTFTVTATDANGCQAFADVEVEISAGPDVEIVGPDITCPEGMVTLELIGGPFDQITWSSGGSGDTEDVGPGAYTVTVADDAGCEAMATYVVDAYPSPEPQIEGPEGLCVGTSGILEVLDDNFQTFEWSTGDFTETTEIFAPGFYSVTVTDDNGCEGEGDYFVQDLGVLTISISGNLIICPNGGSTILDAGPGFDSYEWSNGETFQDIVADFPGDYSVTVVDANGCTATDEVIVEEAPEPMPVINGPEFICPGEQVNLIVDQVFSSYDWSTNQTTRQIAVNEPGFYSVTVTDANGCEGIADFILEDGGEVIVEILGELDFCPGGNTTLLATPGYETYRWSTGAQTDEITVSSQGTYTVTVTNENGCRTIESVNVNIWPLPQPNIIGSPEICEGESTDLRVGAFFDMYEWSTGDDGNEITVFDPGDYSVTVTDDNGCVNSATFELVVNPLPTPEITGPEIICPGGNVVLGLTQQYSNYDWSTGSISQQTVVFDPGIVTVEVTDNNGCMAEASWELIEGEDIDIQILGDAFFCPGGSTELEATDGYVSYQWSNGQTGNIVTINAEGSYTVTVTNDEGCSEEFVIDVDALDAPMPQINGLSPVCFGETGNLTVQGGNFTSYDWSTGEDTRDIAPTSSGTYSVTVTDGSGCSGSDSFDFQVLNQLMPVINGPTAICDNTTGTLTVAGSWASVQWMNGPSTPSYTVNAGGTYTATVTNANGCEATASYTLIENPLPTVAIGGSTAFCPGGNTTLSATPGYASYQWSNSSSTSPNITVNQAGTYSVTVTDANGCRNSTSVVVSIQSELMPVITGALQFCQGTSTVLSVGGNFATYQWSTTASGNSITVTAPGSYSVSVTDASGCSGNATVSVAQLPLPQPVISGDLDFCAGLSTTLQAAANFATYAWSDGTNNATSISVTSPGTYGLTVTDANMCVGSTAVQVVQNPLPTPVITGVLGFCPGQSTTLSTSQPYAAYQWSTGSNTATANVNTAGTVMVTVTDANGCRNSASANTAPYMVDAPDITGALQFCPNTSTVLTGEPGYQSYNWSNGANTAQVTVGSVGNITLNVIDNNNCPSSTTVATSLFVVTPPVISAPAGFCEDANATLSATPGYASYSWTGGQATESITVSTGGVYEVSVVDGNGCPSSAVYDIDVYPLPEPAIGGSLTFCTGSSTLLNAGATYASYQWSDGSTSQEVSVSTPGNIGLTVTDSNGCTGATSTGVNEATELSPVISGPTQYCAGDTIVLSAGNGFATYSWSNGQTGVTSIQVTTPGNYSLSVTDQGGCAGDTQVAIIENPLPTPQIMGNLAYCDGLSTQLTLSTTYSNYDWNTGLPTPGITVSTPGTYSVTVTDANNCVNSTAVDVEEWALPVFTIDGELDFCFGTNTQLSVSPAFAAYSWSNSAAGQSIVVDATGAFAVTVTDGNGCQSNLATAVTEIPLPVADPGANLFLDCDTRMVSLGAGGTTYEGDFSFEWTGPGINSNNANLEVPEVDAPGDYTFVVIDDIYGCESLPVAMTVTDLSYEPMVVIEVLDVLDCATTTVTLDARASSTGPEYVYQWLDGNMSPIAGANSLIYQATTAQYYFLQILDTITGCNNQMGAEVMENVGYPIAEAGIDQLLNCEQTIVELNGSDSEQGNQIRYSWTTTDGNITSSPTQAVISVNQPGWYYIAVRDILNDCENFDSVYVAQNILAPDAATSEGVELDCVLTQTTISGSGSSVGADFAYQWYRDNSLLDGENALSIEVEEPGNYTLIVTNTDNGCTSLASVTITQNPAVPESLAFITDRPTCAGDADGAIILAGVTGGTPPFVYSINGSSFSDATVFRNIVAGNYTVELQDAIGCALTTEIFLQDGNNLDVELGPDQYLDYGDLANIYPDITVDSTELVDIKWETVATLPCEDCLYQLDLSLEESTQFFLTLRDINGCVTSDDVTIFIHKERNIFVPTAFSPNGDGDNDVFYIFADNSVAKIRSFLVFNRWGESVFEVYNSPPNDPRWGWDGKYRGQPVNTAVYVWFAEVEFTNGDIEIIEGDVVIMR